MDDKRDYMPSSRGRRAEVSRCMRDIARYSLSSRADCINTTASFILLHLSLRRSVRACTYVRLCVWLCVYTRLHRSCSFPRLVALCRTYNSRGATFARIASKIYAVVHDRSVQVPIDVRRYAFYS